jgi:sugar (pentulose or hexulose) kinase
MYLGIDLGTSEVKVLLLDADHQVLAVTGESLQISRPRPLWSEQHPDKWWAALDGATRRLAALPVLTAHRLDVGVEALDLCDKRFCDLWD